MAAIIPTAGGKCSRSDGEDNKDQNSFDRGVGPNEGGGAMGKQRPLKWGVGPTSRAVQRRDHWQPPEPYSEKKPRGQPEKRRLN